MSFDPTLPTTRDRIRFMIGDTDTTAEQFEDITYDATIAEYAEWKLAAASMAEALAVKIEQDIQSFSAGGDLSVSWSDRTRSLRALATRLRAEVASESETTSSDIVSVPLYRAGSTGDREYSAQRYRRLIR